MMSHQYRNETSSGALSPPCAQNTQSIGNIDSLCHHPATLLTGILDIIRIPTSRSTSAHVSVSETVSHVPQDKSWYITGCKMHADPTCSTQLPLRNLCRRPLYPIVLQGLTLRILCLMSTMPPQFPLHAGPTSGSFCHKTSFMLD